MPKTKSIKMNMRNAVLDATAKIKDGKRGFFISTEFGEIGVEINSLPQIDPIHPVEVLTWQQGPETQWALAHKDADADYYVSIDIYGSDILDHRSIIEAFSRVMMLDSGFEDISDNIIEAMIICFTNNYDTSQVTINVMVSDYVDTRIKTIFDHVINRKVPIQVQSVVREMFQLKLSSGEEVIQMSEELLKSYKSAGKIDTGYFYDRYCEQIFGVFLYARMKQEKSIDTTLTNIVNFSGINKQGTALAVNK